MKINEMKLAEYVADNEVYEYETEQELLKEINEERFLFWSNEYPNEFKAFEELEPFAGEMVFKYKNKYYWILCTECLDLYV